jgi:hypothetical protein
MSSCREQGCFYLSVGLLRTPLLRTPLSRMSGRPMYQVKYKQKSTFDIYMS